MNTSSLDLLYGDKISMYTCKLAQRNAGGLVNEGLLVEPCDRYGFGIILPPPPALPTSYGPPLDEISGLGKTWLEKANAAANGTAYYYGT